VTGYAAAGSTVVAYPLTEERFWQIIVDLTERQRSTATSAAAERLSPPTGT
jgi:hypothetical protein